MALRLADRWVWDFWLARDGGDYHVFYLQAPRSPHDPELRHVRATIGHAVSGDLRRWERLPDALLPGPAGSWDDLACWTGSVVRTADGWHMLYTGVERRRGRAFQRIGLAASGDLIRWTKHDRNPVLAADPRWYERLDAGAWHEEAWRDPWVFAGADGAFHALITARSRTGPPDGRGVIAHARSGDLRRWEILPPVSEPGDYGQLEVPQLASVGGRHYLCFSVDSSTYAKARPGGDGPPGPTGIVYRRAGSPFGPFTRATERVLLADGPGTFYAGKLVDGPTGLVLLASRARAEDGVFVGELSDPFPVVVDPSGDLIVHADDPVRPDGRQA